MRGARLVVSGAGGIGKTTLAHALAKRLGVPVLAENLAPVVLAMQQISQAKAAGAVAEREAVQVYLKACDRWLRERREAMQDLVQGYVADRWALDILVRWLFAGIRPQDDAMYQRLVRHVQAISRTLDAVVLPPLVQLTSEVNNGEGLRRGQMWSRRLHAQSLTRGLLDQLVPAPKLYLPTQLATVEQRVARVCAALEARSAQQKED